MNKQKQKTLVKAIASGDTATISQLTKQHDIDLQLVSLDGAYQAFFYLLDHSMPEGGGKHSVNKTTAVIRDRSQFDHMVENFEEHLDDFELFTTEALEVFLECAECWLRLEKSDQLHLLDKYKHLIP